MIRSLTLATLALFLIASPARLQPVVAAGKCYSWRCDESKVETPSRQYITNTHRQRIGDLYKPAPNRRTQIRDNSRRIMGYVENDGTITNTHRQKVLGIEALPLAVD